ncbi:hypothetical protein BSKO_12861 [Bryopsis sp. KO-2023]|nr:hypothetical protein BSKO_12861 [Bryopsis sp. KO-2023]
MRGPRIWTEWLPEPVAKQTREDEPLRFRSVVRQFCDDWNANKDQAWPKCYERVLEWFPIIYEYLSLKRDFPFEDVELLVKTCLEIGLGAKDDFEILLRFFDPVTFFLKKYRKEFIGKIEISWKQLYDVCAYVSNGKRFTYQGEDVLTAFRETMMCLIYRSTPFFPKGSAAEIWKTFRPQILHTQGNECFEALGYLTTFLPTSALERKGEGEWGVWFEEWLDLFEGMTSCDFWDACWLDLFASVAKHDHHGQINWTKYMDRLFVGFLTRFHVPVGTATSDMRQFSTYPSHRASLLFKNSGTGSIPKCIIYMLRNEKNEESCIQHLEMLIALLEQYYHPSNGGKWTRSLWQFLRLLLKNFMQQLSKQGRHNETSPGMSISPAVQERCFACFLKISLRGQYSKDDTLRLTACQSMCDLSYVAPKLVLPLVYKRFQDALESMTATLTLPTSIHALGICVRPLLLSGLSADLTSPGYWLDGEEVAGQAIARAMMDVLPGLDANDTTKTGAVLRFYCAVMYSIPSLDTEIAEKNGWYVLPLDVELWCEELLSRLFVLMENLDAPAHRTDQSHRTEKTSSKGTFLMHDHVFFDSFTDLLLVKLPVSLRVRAIKRMADFMLTSAVPCVVQECGQLCSSAGEVDPESTMQYIVHPLLEKVLEELPAVQGGQPSTTHFSHALETMLVWNLGLLSTCMGGVGEHVLKHEKMAVEVVDRALACTCREVQVSGMVLLSALLACLIGVYPELNQEQFKKNILESGLHQWVAKEPETWEPPMWHHPSAKELSLADTLITKYLEGGLAELDALMEDPPEGDDFKEKLMWNLCKIDGVLGGCKECLVDFEVPEKIHSGENSKPVGTVGHVGITVGKPGLRERAADTIVRLCSFVQDQDPTVLEFVVEIIEELVSLGESGPPDEYSDINTSDEPDVLDVFFTEPAVATPLLKKADLKWQKRGPYHRVLCNLWEEYLNRSGDSAYGRWHSTTVPMIEDVNLVPEAFGRLFGELIRLSMHRYEGVRHAAEPVVEQGFIRFPCLTRYYVPVLLTSVARSPLPEDLSLSALSSNPNFLKEVLDRLGDFMKQIEVDTIMPTGNDVEMGVEAEQDAAVDGAVCVMCTSQHSFKATFKEPERLAAMVYALMASRQNTSVTSQGITSYFIWKFLVRFHSPIHLKTGPLDGFMADVCKGLLFLGREGVIMNWKYTLLANILTLAMLPRRDHPLALSILSHFLEVMDSKLPALRKVSTVGLYSILRPLQIADVENSEMVDLVRSHVNQPAFGATLVHILVNGHISLGEEDDNKGKMAKYLKHLMVDGSFEERLVRNVHVLVDRLGKWPESDNPEAMLDGSFDLPNARVVEAVAAIVPFEFLSSIREPAEKLLEVMQSHSSEQADQSALAELLSGIIASGAPWVQPKNSSKTPWEDWIKEFTKAVLGSAPLELSGAFALSMRSGVRGLLDLNEQGKGYAAEALGSVVDLILSAMDASVAGQSSSLIKHLTYLNASMKELIKVYSLEGMPPNLIPLWSRLLDDIPGLMSNELQSVREHVAGLMVLVCGYLLSQQQAGLSQDKLKVVTKAQEVCDLLVARFEEGIQSVRMMVNQADSSTDANTDTMQEGSEKGSQEAGVENGLTVAVDAKVGMAAQFAILGMREVQSPSLERTLIRLLPGLFQIQELGDPSLKPLQMEAATAFVLLKYLCVSVDRVGDVVDIITASHRYEQWHARAAALVFQQVFWFRHCFLLSQAHSKQMLEYVMGRLGDKKLEVQMVASTTLSGMLKGMASDQEEKVRSHFMSQLAKFYPNGRRPRRKKQDPQVLLEKHTCILGIRAFITCHPYDIPEWMPEMLTAAVPAAGEPAPIKTTITKTLGDFRRTHENESHQELRAAFDEDQWEALQGVGSQASYFT